MRHLLTCGLLFIASDIFAQSLTITDVREAGNVVEISIETTIDGPIEIMTGIDLAGQAPDDIYIGVSERVTIEKRSTVAIISLVARDGSLLPSGAYEAVATFYPRWGAENAPASTRGIDQKVEADPVPITLRGSGQVADDVAKRDELQRWVMLNVTVGMPFNGSALTARLGAPEQIAVTNRTHIIVAWYYPDVDMTIFESTVTGEVVTWREGRQDAL